MTSTFDYCRLLPSLAVLMGIGFLQPVVHGQLVLGQLDDFQGGLDGWQSGSPIPPNPTPPTIVPNVGPNGTGDTAMQITSSGGSGAGSQLVAFNTAQWDGNYLSAGVTSITVDLKNTGTTDLTMRLAFRGPDLTTWFVTNLGFDLTAGSAWQQAQFSLAEFDLTRVAGTQTYATTFGNVSEMRLLDNPALDFRGAPVVASVLVDNIAAVPEPSSDAAVLALCAAATAACLRSSKESRSALRLHASGANRLGGPPDRP